MLTFRRSLCSQGTSGQPAPVPEPVLHNAPPATAVTPRLTELMHIETDCAIVASPDSAALHAALSPRTPKPATSPEPQPQSLARSPTHDAESDSDPSFNTSADRAGDGAPEIESPVPQVDELSQQRRPELSAAEEAFENSGFSATGRTAEELLAHTGTSALGVPPSPPPPPPPPLLYCRSGLFALINY